MRSAVGWLQMTVFCTVLTSVFWFLPPAIVRDRLGVLTAIYLAVPIIFAPLILLVIGIGAFQRLSSWGLALTAGLVSLYLAVYHLVPLLVTTMLLIAALRDDQPGEFLICWIILPLAILCLVSGAVGGIRTLVVLNRPDVAEAFR